MKCQVSFEQQTCHVHFAPGPPASCSVTLTHPACPEGILPGPVKRKKALTAKTWFCLPLRAHASCASRGARTGEKINSQRTLLHCSLPGPERHAEGSSSTVAFLTQRHLFRILPQFLSHAPPPPTTSLNDPLSHSSSCGLSAYFQWSRREHTQTFKMPAGPHP